MPQNRGSLHTIYVHRLKAYYEKFIKRETTAWPIFVRPLEKLSEK